MSAAWEDVLLSGLDGSVARAAEAGDTEWTVFVFIARECPVANRSIPELNRLHAESAERGFSLHGVYVDTAASAAALRSHAEVYGVNFPVWRDDARHLTRYTGARITPEAVVLDREGTVRYRGRVDDRFGGFGQSRPEATRRDLDEALAALTAGDAPREKDRPGFGCPIPEITDAD